MMIFIGYLFGIRSERQLGLSLTDPVPDHTTISWNHRTRFQNTNVFQEIFDEIVHLAIQHRTVGGRENVQGQALLTATVQNIKQIALHLAKAC